MSTNTTPSGADAPGHQDTKFKVGMERGPLDKYVARQAWFAALSAASAAGPADEREAFEQWFRREFRSTLYCESRWEAWQARAALSADAVDERAAFERCYQADFNDPGAADERRHFVAGFRAALAAATAAPQPAAQQGDSLLKEVVPWLHAAYDRPPQTPEIKALLSRVDAALAAQAQEAAPPEKLAKRLIGEVAQADALATSVCRSVAELPDRDSPDGWPEAMLVTADELHLIVREAVIEAQEAAPAAQGEPSAEQALRKILEAIRRYLPPDGPSARDTITEIIALVDPWPLGDPKGPK